MNFKHKAFVQHVLSIAPGGTALNHLLQRHLTHRYPVPDNVFINRVKTAVWHFESWRKYHWGFDPSRATAYEFGAGWDLINPISLTLFGIGTQYVLDIRKQLFTGALNETIRNFRFLKDHIPRDYVSPPDSLRFTKTNITTALREAFNIFYMAPADARCTGLNSESVDFIASNFTLEHVPREDIPRILRESYRIMKPGGILTCIVDCTDHWAHFDRSISVYNFLRYSEKDWKKYNPPLHFQNRMRCKDYLEIVGKTEFTALEISQTPVTEWYMNDPSLAAAHPDFTGWYSKEELAVRSFRMILKK